MGGGPHGSAGDTKHRPETCEDALLTMRKKWRGDRAIFVSEDVSEF